MSFGSIQRYVNSTFTCVNCGEINKVRIDTLNDLRYKRKNPPIPGGNRQTPYYERNCERCHAYNAVIWQGNAGN